MSKEKEVWIKGRSPTKSWDYYFCNVCSNLVQDTCYIKANKFRLKPEVLCLNCAKGLREAGLLKSKKEKEE